MIIEKFTRKVKNIKTVDIMKGHPNLHYVDYVEDFVDYIIEKQRIPKFKELKIAFDNKYGSSAEEIELLCKKLGIKNYKLLNGNRDALFNKLLPAPFAENVDDLRREVVKGKYDIGFAVDADGDRIGIVDEKGNFIDNNKIMALVYYYLVKYEKKKGPIVKNVATSVLCDWVAKNLGFKCIEVPVGFKFVSDQLVAAKAVVAGESSGGLAVQNHILGKDSLLSIALCIKILKKLNKPISKIMKEVITFADNYSKTIYDMQYTYAEEKKNEIMNIVFKQKLRPESNRPIVKIVYDEFLKIYYENNNWILVRFSGTEPVLRIFAEFDSLDECKREIKLWEDFLQVEPVYPFGNPDKKA